MKKYGFTIVNSYYDSSHMSYNGLSRTFQWLWKAVGNNLDKYTGFPKMVGECGGKNYHFVHPTAEVETVVASTIRSAFEYQVAYTVYFYHPIWFGKVNKQAFKVKNICGFGEMS